MLIKIRDQSLFAQYNECHKEGICGIWFKIEQFNIFYYVIISYLEKIFYVNTTGFKLLIYMKLDVSFMFTYHLDDLLVFAFQIQ